MHSNNKHIPVRKAAQLEPETAIARKKQAVFMQRDTTIPHAFFQLSSANLCKRERYEKCIKEAEIIMN